MGDDTTSLAVIELIASHHIDQYSPDNEFNQEARKSAERGKKIAQTVMDNDAEEKALYYETVEAFIDRHSAWKKIFRIPLDIYNPLVSPKLEHADHELRKAEERYLLKKKRIPDTGDSVKNWALIGMALAEKEPDCPRKILFKDEFANRNKGRPSKGLSVDYKRAVWRLMVDSFAYEHAEKKAAFFKRDEEEYSFTVTVYTLGELLDGYLYAFDCPEAHDYMWIFENLEANLKMRFLSRATLLTSFSRGEKERAKLWDT